MKHKNISVVILLIAALILIAAPIAVYGAEIPPPEQIPEQLPEDIPPPQPPPEPPLLPEPEAFTPPGNLTLVDDLSGTAADGKQFITVVTKGGEYFYIVIDRTDDRENVHFLNLVDEADLIAILEDGKKQTTAPTPVEPEPEIMPEPEPAPAAVAEPPKANNTGGITAIILILALISGGAYFFLKVVKPKKATHGTAATELDEFEFDDDDDEDAELSEGNFPYETNDFSAEKPEDHSE
jgi:hypothetical protein